MIKRFWHVGITVKDLDSAIAEYEKLGFKLINQFKEDDPNCLIAELGHRNGSVLELFQWLDKNHPQIEFIKNHTAFESDDIDSDTKELEELGWKVVIPKKVGDTVTYIFLQDLSGNNVELAEIRR